MGSSRKRKSSKKPFCRMKTRDGKRCRNRVDKPGDVCHVHRRAVARKSSKPTMAEPAKMAPSSMPFSPAPKASPTKERPPRPPRSPKGKLPPRPTGAAPARLPATPGSPPPKASPTKERPPRQWGAASKARRFVTPTPRQ